MRHPSATTVSIPNFLKPIAAGIRSCLGVGQFPGLVLGLMAVAQFLQAQPNLTAYKPPGWSATLVVSNAPDSSVAKAIDAGPLGPTDQLYVSWANTNIGTSAITKGFYTDAYVDGTLSTGWYTDYLPVNSFAIGLNNSIGTLSVGIHTISIVIDSTHTIAESNEFDNLYTKDIRIVDSTGARRGVSIIPAEPPVPPSVARDGSGLARTPTITVAIEGPLAVEPGRRTTWTAVAPDRSPATKINPRVFAGTGDQQRTTFLVVLGEQADLSAAAAIPDRFARRRFVYETLHGLAEGTQVSLRQQLERAGAGFRPHYLVNMIEVEGTSALADELSRSAEVSAIEPDFPSTAELAIGRRAPRPLTSGTSEIEPNIGKVRAPAMWALGFSGQGIVIGIADTGFAWQHPALKRQYRGWDGSAVSHDYNWHDAVHDANDIFHTPRILSCGSNAPAPCDDIGHGTATASLAVGDDGEGNRVGVAPGARFIGCRNMDQGTGTPARYLECLEWLFAPTDSKNAHPRVDLGADIISNSWLCAFSEGCTDPEILRKAVENVRAAGVPFLAAAGNDGFACGNIFFPPAIYDASITVGATDMSDLHPFFSSPGPVTVDGSWRLKPDLSAPGQDIRAAWLDSYVVISGTSVATPEVAGGIALLWSALPVLAGDVDGTETALENGAVPLTSPMVEAVYSPDERQRLCGGYSGLVVPNILFGWGRLDVEAAYVKYARSLNGASPRNGPVVPAPPDPPALVAPPRSRR